MFTGHESEKSSTTLPSPESTSESDGFSAQQSLNRYGEDWTLVTKCLDFAYMTRMSVEGDLRASKFRSIFWRIFLKILGKDPKNWVLEIRNHRSQYESLISELEGAPWSSSNRLVDNPLSQEQEVSSRILYRIQGGLCQLFLGL